MESDFESHTFDHWIRDLEDFKNVKPKEINREKELEKQINDIRRSCQRMIKVIDASRPVSEITVLKHQGRREAFELVLKWIDSYAVGRVSVEGNV